MVFVKVLIYQKKSFDMSNEKATEGQIRERKIHVYTWTPWSYLLKSAYENLKTHSFTVSLGC